MKIKMQHIKIHDADKAMSIGKCIALNAYFKKEDGPQINNLCS